MRACAQKCEQAGIQQMESAWIVRWQDSRKWCTQRRDAMNTDLNTNLAKIRNQQALCLEALTNNYESQNMERNQVDDENVSSPSRHHIEV